MPKHLMKGNEAFGEAAIKAGAQIYFCYPITPQTEVAEYLSKRMPEAGGVFLQGESELAVGNMIFGASAVGARVFTSSSSPGISLMQEAISYIANAELPSVFLNVVRAGPGLGGILPAQSDYNQAVRGGGHGDYRVIVFAPASIQEMVDLTMEAFYFAEKYRNPVMVIADGMLGQMMEPVEFKKVPDYSDLPAKDWATTGSKGRAPNIVKTLYLDAGKLDKHNDHLTAKYEQVKKEVRRFEEYNCGKGMKLLVTAFGTMARICKTVIDELKKEKINVGLFRPISLFPFPDIELEKCARSVKKVLDIEMNTGQMVEDVQRVLPKDKIIKFYGRSGGIVPSMEEVRKTILDMIRSN